MRRVIFITLVALVALAVASFGVYWLTTGRYIESTDNAYVEADIAVIAPRIAGYIRTVEVDDNQPVRRGDVLVTLEDTDYRARVAAAEAQLAAGNSAVGTAEAMTATRTAAIREAEAALAAAQAEANRAETDRARLAKLLDQGFVSRQRYDVALAEAASRRAAVAQARATVAAARSGVSGAASERSTAAATSRAAAAEAEAARFELANTIIRAPIDGVVGNRFARVGQYVRPGQQLMAVVPVAAVYVVANFKETQVARMTPGQPVSIEVDAYPGREVRGHIASLSPAAGSRFTILPPENATGNFTKIVQRVPIKIRLDQPLPAGLRLVPGMSVEASLDVRSKADGQHGRPR